MTRYQRIGFVLFFYGLAGWTTLLIKQWTEHTWIINTILYVANCFILVVGSLLFVFSADKRKTVMNNTIWKYVLSTEYVQIISVFSDTQFLTVQVQDDKPCLWVLCNPKDETTTVKVITVRTGGETEDADDMQYVGTYQLADGFVGHVFVER